MVAFVTFFFSWFIVEDGLFCFVFFFFLSVEGTKELKSGYE